MLTKLYRMQDDALRRYNLMKTAKKRQDDKFQAAKEDVEVITRLIKRERGEA